MGVGLRQTFRATPLQLCHETSACGLEVSLSCLDLSLALGERMAEATAVAEAG